MILSDKSIKELLKSGSLVIKDNYTKENSGCDYISDGVSIQPASFDLRLGSCFGIPKHNSYSLSERGEVVDVVRLTERGVTSHLVNDRFIIAPKEFVLATTREYIKLPDDLTAFVEGRSSIGRTGLVVQNAGWVDPGFEGEITLELFNASSNPIELISGMRVAQLVFAQLDQKAEHPYQGKYQKQVGAVGSKISYDTDIVK